MKVRLKRNETVIDFELTNDDDGNNWNLFFQFAAAMLREKSPTKPIPEDDES